MFRAPMGAFGFAIAFDFSRFFVAMKFTRVGFSRARHLQLIKQDYWSYGDPAVGRTFSAAGSLRLQRGNGHENSQKSFCWPRGCSARLWAPFGFAIAFDFSRLFVAMKSARVGSSRDSGWSRAMVSKFVGYSFGFSVAAG
jgi:hypothetical protein